MNERRALPALAVWAAAAAGVVLAHALGYVAAAPDEHAREALLADTGHGYWPLAVNVAVLLAGSSLAAVVVRAFRLDERTRVPPLSLGALTARLAAIQIAVFVVMEVRERTAAGEPVPAFFGSRLFLLGVLVQMAVALATALVLRWLVGAAALVARAFRRLPGLRSAAGTWPVRLSVARRPAHVLVGAGGVRGPPSS